jgi:hypothetical protein
MFGVDAAYDMDCNDFIVAQYPFDSSFDELTLHIIDWDDDIQNRIKIELLMRENPLALKNYILVDESATTVEEFIRANLEKDVEPVTLEDVDQVLKLKADESVHIGMCEVKRMLNYLEDDSSVVFAVGKYKRCQVRELEHEAMIYALDGFADVGCTLDDEILVCDNSTYQILVKREGADEKFYTFYDRKSVLGTFGECVEFLRAYGDY